MFAARDASPNSTRWGIPDAALWFVVGFIGQSVWAVLLVGVFYGGDVPDPLPVGLLVGLQTWLWFAYGVGPVVSTLRRGAGPVVELGARIRSADVPLGLVVGIGLQLVVLPLLYVPILEFVDADPSEAAEELVSIVDGPVDALLMVLVVAVMAPLVEELFYRGLVLGALLQRLPVAAAVIVQAVVFAGAHLQLVQFPGLLVVGLVCGYLRIRYDRLGPAWAAHFGFNAITLAVLLRDAL